MLASLKTGVKVDWVPNKPVDHIRVVSWELLVNHQAQNTHHRGSSIVQLNTSFTLLLFRSEGRPSEIKGVVTKVTNELTTGDIFHYSELQEPDKCKDLQ